MIDDLVKRLRVRPLSVLVNPTAMCSEAADRIEALTAENERLREAGNDLVSIPGHSPTCGWEDGASCTCGYSEVAEAWGRAALAGKAEQ